MNWIDIHDKMPDHNETVICCNVNDPESPICLGMKILDSEVEFYIFELDEKTKQVTHWMELPNKPKIK